MIALMQRTIYLAGPMRGLPDHNYPAFDAAARELRDAGHVVINPTELFDGDLTLTRADYMRGGLRALFDVNAIAMLPGWMNSPGAVLELTVARALDLELLEYVAGVGVRELFGVDD